MGISLLEMLLFDYVDTALQRLPVLLIELKMNSIIDGAINKAMNVGDMARLIRAYTDGYP